MRTLSVRQPWAWLIVNGHKPIENRDWETMYRGPVLIHAGKTLTKAYHAEVSAHVLDTFGITVPAIEALERGGVVGRADLVSVVRESDSLWFQGDCFGFVLANAQPLPFTPWKGQLQFFDVPTSALRNAEEVAA